MRQIAPGVFWLPLGVSNAYFIGDVSGPWIVIDSGTPGHFETIRAAATERFGADSKPEAVVLTHGHFDHAGSALALAAHYDVPIYVHPGEMPFVSGKSKYPPGDPTVGGFFAFLFRFMPPSGTDLGRFVRVLPEDGTVPGLPGWKWLHTPGHTPGHVSLWREQDKVLVAGDAVITVNVDSAIAMTTQRQEICRPPAPATTDWDAARASVEKLAALKPYTVAAGHGLPFPGPQVASELQTLADDFERPAHGRYRSEPAKTNEQGVVSVPPPASDPLPKVLVGVGLALVVIGLLARAPQHRTEK